MSSARALTRAPPFFFPLQGVSMITRLFPPPSHGQASGALDASRAREPRPRCAVIFVSTSPLNLPLRCPPRIVRSSGAHGGTNRERSEPKMNNYRSVMARGSRGGGGEKKEKEKRRKSSSMRRKLTRCSLIELVGEPRHAIPLNVCVLRMQHCLKIFSVKRCYIIALTRDFFFIRKRQLKN